mgnify:FL=1
MTGEEKGEPIAILIMLPSHWVELSMMKKMKIAIDIRDRAVERRTYGSLGNAYDSLGELDLAKVVLLLAKTLLFQIYFHRKSREISH